MLLLFLPFRHKIPDENNPDSGEKITLEDTAIVATLITTLNNTCKQAEKNDDKKIMAICQNLLKKLPEFRTVWLQHYDKAMLKRDTMSDKKALKNLYLNYSSHRLAKKVET